ncbi:MAG: FeoA domain-containing protein, partial [Ruminococcus sp.]|nr:FeoA domain-containing protein [Ruminococcus sp.]
MKLKEMDVGQSAVITEVGGEGVLRQHFLDMGVIPGIEVKVVKLAPMGDPMQIMLHGYVLSLRLAEAEKIEVSPLKEKTKTADGHKTAKSAHPGLGEGGRFHEKGSGDPLPDDTVLTYALVGNQNSGKTTLFNQLTGSNQHVGNFPGVTVDRKS